MLLFATALTLLSPQPLQVGPEASAPLVIELPVPQNLTPGALACYSVTTTHLESGRTFVSRAGIYGRQRRQAQTSRP